MKFKRSTSAAGGALLAVCLGVCLTWLGAARLIGQSGAQKTPSTNPADFVNQDRIAALTQRLVQINSEYDWPDLHNHKEMADFLERQLRQIGMAVEVVRANPDYPVVIGRLKGTTGKPALGFATHYNNVVIGNQAKWSFDPMGGEYKDGRVYGRGASNSKGSVAGDIETARALKESGVKLSGDLVLVFMPGEGATEFAMPWIVQNRPDLIKADWYMGGGGGGNFTRMHAGHQWLKLIVKGTMAHPPCHSPCVNAATKLLQVLPRVVKLEDWMRWKSEPPFESRKPTADVGKIVAGYSVNVIPDRAEADIDIRTVPTQTHEQIKAELDALLTRLKKEDPELDVEVQWIWWSIVPYQDWFKLTEDELIVKAIMEIAPKYTGRKPEWSRGVGGGAGRPDLWASGSKVIYFGIGGGGGSGAHGYDEWVRVDGIARNARFQVELAAAVLK